MQPERWPSGSVDEARHPAYLVPALAMGRPHEQRHATRQRRRGMLTPVGVQIRRSRVDQRPQVEGLAPSGRRDDGMERYRVGDDRRDLREQACERRHGEARRAHALDDGLDVVGTRVVDDGADRSGMIVHRRLVERPWIRPGVDAAAPVLEPDVVAAGDQARRRGCVRSARPATTRCAFRRRARGERALGSARRGHAR